MKKVRSFLRYIACRNWFGRFAVDQVHLIYNLVCVMLGKKTKIVGARRLPHEIFSLLNKYNQPVTIYKNYLMVGNSRVRKISSLTAAFLPIEKIIFNPDSLINISARVAKILTPSSPETTRNYYTAYWLYLVTFYISFAINITMLVMYLDLYITFYTYEQYATEFWLVSNTYLTLQLYIFHKTRLRFIAFSGMFYEALPSEERNLLFSPDCPESIILIPAYREEPELLRRSILCHALQKVGKKKVVLLLGNEFYTDDVRLQKNTELIYDNCAALSAFMKHYSDELEKISQNTTATLSDVMMLTSVFSQRLEEMASDIEHSSIKFPTDSYVVNDVIRKMSVFFKTIGDEMPDSSTDTLVQYLKSFFNVEIEVFMRMKYANTEHEKTKAGNLTAYLPYVNYRYHEEYDETEKIWRLVRDESEHRFDYVGIFDCDTICRPEYLLRKICYLQRTGTEEIGLIQSPYIVPVPEPSIASVASGIQSFWFLPISIGLSGYNSSFWLGFNSCWRYEALSKVPSFLSETIIEDVEVSLQLIRQKYKIVTSPEQQCMTYSPKDLRGIQIQRTRWASGGLRILYSFVRDVIKRRYDLVNFAEFIMRSNYIINLNLLPVFILLQFLIRTPLHYNSVALIMINYCAYLFLYFKITRQYSKYSPRELFDGMIIGIMMNFYYLRGLKTSVIRLLKPKSNLFFMSTPRQADTVKQVGRKTVFQHNLTSEVQIDLFEIIALVLTFATFASAFFFNVYRGYFYDIFPIFQMFCILYLIHRFVGAKKFVSTLFKLIGHYLMGIKQWVRFARVS